MDRFMSKLKMNVNSTISRYYAFVFFKDLAFFSAVLVPFFTDWGGINLTQVQILQSWFMFWMFILEIPTGAVADFIGRKHSLALGALVVAVAALVYGSLPNFGVFLLGEFLFATAMAMMSGADEALLYDSLKEVGREDESRKFFGRANSIRLTGMLLAAPIGSFIASRIGLNMPMVLSAIPYLLASVIAWSIREPGIRVKNSESIRYLIIVREGIKSLKENKKLKLLAIDAIVVSSAANFIIWLYQPFLKLVGIPILYFGGVHAMLVLAEIIVSSNFERLTKILKGDKQYLRFSAAVVAFSFFLVALFPNALSVFAFVIIGGGVGLTRLNFMSAIMNKYIDSKNRATILSSISMFRRFALVFLNPIMGFIADRSLVVASFSVGLLALGIFLFSPLRKEALD